MIAFLAWYLIVTLLGWLTFPLAYALFPGLADRGYSLARAAGLLLWGYIYWLLNSLGLMQNDIGGVLLAALLLAALTAASARLSQSTITERKTELLAWLRAHLRLVLAVEILFLLSFAFLAFIRAGNPELDNAEKPMELMFINAILRSPSFPPQDAWLSGYAISYYYFGYVMTAMLAMLTGLTGSVAHNLMTALIFGLAAIGAYAAPCWLLGSRERRRRSRLTRPPVQAARIPILALLARPSSRLSFCSWSATSRASWRCCTASASSGETRRTSGPGSTSKSSGSRPPSR
jgi:hypothetical protein